MKYSLMDTVAYRGDTRDPYEIFTKGFWNKQTPEFLWPLIAKGEKYDREFGVKVRPIEGSGTFTEHEMSNLDMSLLDVEPLQSNKNVYRIFLRSNREKYILVETKNSTGGQVYKTLYQRYAINKPQFRNKTYWKLKEPRSYGHLSGSTLLQKLIEDRRTLWDINPDSAVCLTLRPEVAPYFPIDGGETGQWIWIYAMWVGAAVNTYNYQVTHGTNLIFAREIAVEHVPPSHIICAVKCLRKGKYPDMLFNMTPRIYWNRFCRQEIRTRWAAYVEDVLMPFQGYITRCPTSTQPTTRIRRELLFE